MTKSMNFFGGKGLIDAEQNVQRFSLVKNLVLYLIPYASLFRLLLKRSFCSTNLCHCCLWIL